MRHARRLDPSLLINLFTHRVQIDVKVGKENCCDKEVRNRQRSWKVLCERFLQELGRTEGPLSSVFSQCQVHQFEAGTNRSMSFARHFPRNSEAFQGLSSLVKTQCSPSLTCPCMVCRVTANPPFIRFLYHQCLEGHCSFSLPLIHQGAKISGPYSIFSAVLAEQLA